jgi:hypothetical protein
MDSYPKFQVSKMEGEYQVVFRTDDKVEFDKFITEIKAISMKGAPSAMDTQFPNKPVTQSVGGFKKQEAGETCNKCGKAKIVLNPRTGKTFCEAKCWLNGSKTY